MKVRANGIDVNCEVSGEGRCLVLIHGFTDNLNIWFNQVPVFSKQHKVLTVDVRGFGRTEGGREPYSMRLFAADLYELLRALGIDSACVLGYSTGCHRRAEITCIDVVSPGTTWSDRPGSPNRVDLLEHIGLGGLCRVEVPPELQIQPTPSWWIRFA